MRTVLAAACYGGGLLAALILLLAYIAALSQALGVFGVVVALMTIPLALVFPFFAWIDTGSFPLLLFLLMGIMFAGTMTGAAIASSGSRDF